MPRVKIRFYSQLRDLVGSPAETMFVDEGARVQDVVSAVFCRFPQLMPFKDSILVARNAEFTRADVLVNDDDTIDIMPPVSGG